MEFLLNGESCCDLPEGASIALLVGQLDLVGKRIAVEVNLNIVPRSDYGKCQIRAGDKVEVVQAVGGG